MELALSKTSIVAVWLLLFVAYKLIFNRRRTANVPGIGYGSLPILGPWQGVIAFMTDPQGTIARGCAQYKGRYFRVSTHSVEYVMVADKAKLVEYLSAPEDHLSFHDQVNEFLQVEWTMGRGVAHRPYHIPLIRTKLTQTIAGNIPSILQEIQEAMHALVSSEDWTEVKIYNVMVRVVAKASNNAFTGMQFCRNEEYLDNAIAYAQSVVISAEILRLVPQWMKPLVAWLTPFRKMQQQARDLAGPLVQKRIDHDWEGKEPPKDMIQFLIDSAPDEERTMPQIVERMMTLNMASIHTTTMTITSAICLLAREQEKYVPVLRAELKEHCIDGKLEKQALGKLVKLDSFLRECGRVQPLGNITSVRVARKDFTFSDGMVIPAGNTVAAPLKMLHDGDLADPDVFDGFRYSQLNEESTGPTKYQMVSTDYDYLLFGHGKHACPGRFLAVTEMKLMLATILLDYDIKLIPGTAPKETFFGTARIPDAEFSILMKKLPMEA